MSWIVRALAALLLWAGIAPSAVHLGVAAQRTAVVQKHALIVGISDADLKFGESDAAAFRDLIRDSLGFDPQRTEFLSGQQASRDGILKAIDRIGRRVTIDRNNGDDPLVFIYYAGHSVADDAGTTYLLTSGSSASVPSTGLKTAEFMAEIKSKVTSDRIVSFLDTCFAAASANGGQSRAVEGPFKAIDQMWTSYFPRAEGLRMGFFSSSANQKSWEDPVYGGGIFTNYLLRGLRGEADTAPIGNQDGVVTAGELKQYLDATVPRHATWLGREQTPLPTPVFDYSLPLARSETDALLGIYRERIPDEAMTAIRAQVRSGNRLRSISFDDAGHFAIVSDKQFVADQRIKDLVANFRAQRYPGSPGDVSSIWLYGDGSCVIILDALGYQPCIADLPQAALEGLEAARSARTPLASLAITAEKTSVQIGNGYRHSAGIPTEMADQLRRLQATGARLDMAALASPYWVIVYGGGGFQAYGPTELLRTLASLNLRKKTIQAMAFNRSTNGWVIVADR